MATIKVLTPTLAFKEGLRITPDLLASFGPKHHTEIDENACCVYSEPLDQYYIRFEYGKFRLDINVKYPVEGGEAQISLDQKGKVWGSCTDLATVLSQNAFGEWERRVSDHIHYPVLDLEKTKDNYVLISSDAFPFKVTRPLTLQEFDELYKVSKGKVGSSPDEIKLSVPSKKIGESCVVSISKDYKVTLVH
jgi:hypothetical protein